MKNFYDNNTEKPGKHITGSILYPSPHELKKIREEIGTRLKEVYQDSGLSQETFARSLGVSKSALNRYIGGKSEPKASTIRLLLENHKVNPMWLITGRGIKYLERVGEEPLLYSLERGGEGPFGEVMKKLHSQPDLVQILHKLLKTDPSQKETIEAYLMALEMALKVQKEEKGETK